MMTTLDDVKSKKSEPSAEEAAAVELVRLAKEQGLSLTGPDGLLTQFTKHVLETALNDDGAQRISSVLLVETLNRHGFRSSWLNLVERWFRELTEKALRRGVFHSVPDLIAAIEDYLDAHNDEPNPLIWTATAESILEKVARGRVALQTVNQN